MSRHGVTFPMVWDRGFESWDAFGIQGQPASILLSGTGQEIKRWIGALDKSEHAEVIELARTSG